MEHEDGFDPCNGMPGSNIRFRLIKYWVNLYSKPAYRPLFGGGVGGAKRKGEPSESDAEGKTKRPRAAGVKEKKRP